jgi:hypothetical protein
MTRAGPKTGADPKSFGEAEEFLLLVFFALHAVLDQFHEHSERLPAVQESARINRQNE